MKKVTIILLVACSYIISCFNTDKEVSCKAISYLHIKNIGPDTLVIKLERNSEMVSSYISRFSSDSLIFFGSDSIDDTVFFIWKDNNDCHLYCEHDIGWNSFTLRVLKNNLLISSRIVYPCDSTEQSFISTCENCLHEGFDTLTIP